MDLPLLGVSCKWTDTIGGLVCLTSFTQHNVFKVHGDSVLNISGARISLAPAIITPL